MTKLATMDLRDHWTCETCGVGMCVPAGVTVEAQHVLLNGEVCGAYELTEQNIDCFSDDEREGR